MPRKRRVAKQRRSLAPLRPCVERFLETGVVELDESDNPWIAISLLDPAATDARAHWARGDETGALAALARCSGAGRWYLL